MTDRIGFRTIGFRRFSPEEAIQRIAAAGYDGVEVCLEHPGLEPDRISVITAAELARTAETAGLQIATVSYHGDRDPLSLRWERAMKAIELTPMLGAAILIVNSPRPGPDNADELRDEFRRQLDRQLERAQRLGVTLALEPEPGLLVHDCTDMLALLREVGSDALAVNIDVGHAFLTEDDLSASIRHLGSSIVCTHIEDMPAGEHRHLVPGEGEMNLPEVVSSLRATGFDGWLTVDLFDIADAPDEAAQASLRAMRELLGS